MSSTPTAVTPAAPTLSSSRDRSSRPLLAAGAAAGPLFAAVSWLQVATVDEFDIARHALSQLSLGPHGWVQAANFVLSGTLFLAGAIGLRRALHGHRGGTWGPRLLGAFAVTQVIAGLFPTDPANGYPADTLTPAHPSWHGIVHAAAPGLGIVLMAIACFVFARGFWGEGRRPWSAASIAVGLLMFSPDAYPGPTGDGYTLALAVTGTLGFVWCSVVAADRLRCSTS